MLDWLTGQSLIPIDFESLVFQSKFLELRLILHLMNEFRSKDSFVYTQCLWYKYTWSKLTHILV